MAWLSVASYGITAVLYGAAAVVLLVSLPKGRRASLLVGAVGLSGLWAACLTLLLLFADARRLGLFVGLDGLHALVWIICVVSWPDPASARQWLLVAAAAVGAWLIVPFLPGSPLAPFVSTVYAAVVILALIGLLAVEQVYRSARGNQRRHLKLLCLAAAGIFAIDLFVYSHAALFGGLNPFLWAARGIANGALLLLVVLGAKQHSEWERELFVSRQVVFYTASLLAIGGYLLAMTIVAYFIRAYGEHWGLAGELLFLAAAASLLLVLLSPGIRAYFKVLIIKHFFRNKYDYRAEWVRLTQCLGRTGDLRVVASNALEGLARIIGAQEGSLYLEREPGRFDAMASRGGEPPRRDYRTDHPLPAFLASTNWVVDSDEYAREPSRYGMAFGDPGDGLLPRNALIVPLDQQGYLQGFVVLRKPAELPALNFEDHDLLKTAGKQVAAVLAQALAQEQLAETRQFEAMSRLTAFLMHDLKNIVAQQDLVVANAQRFRHRPEFIDDAIETVQASVQRMKKVLELLANTARTASPTGRVDVSKVLMEVRSQCADRMPIPEVELNAPAAWVIMDREQLASVLLHLVRNAQDATPPDGSIKIHVTRCRDAVEIVVADTGCGMSPDFVRDQLFRPFHSTKGAEGMGMGAYQVRHLVRLAGGDVDVTSEPGIGTTFRLRVPAAVA